MRNRFLLLFIIFPFLVVAQKTIVKGSVFTNNQPLEGVAVYFNNTMLGTTTNENGEFTIAIKEGKYDLVVSYLGYKKVIYNLTTAEYKKALKFNLEEERSTLNEVIIKKTIYDDVWKNNLYVFEQEFIGQTELSKQCKILNPEVLHFEFDINKNILKAFARKPLQIQHKGLGYLIIYDLENFIRTKDYVRYLGYSRYKELKGGKNKQKRWKKNREKAYKGSAIHFFKSLLKNTYTEEGFIVNQFKRVPNPERPSEEEIANAKETLKRNRNRVITLGKPIYKKSQIVDAALIIVRKSRLEKFRDYLYKSKLNQDDIITTKNGKAYLTFNDNLSIVYLKEKEEMAYILRNAFSKKRKPLPQTSSLIPLKKGIIVDKNGLLIDPLDVFYEGYWSYYEKIATYLPLDYELPKD